MQQQMQQFVAEVAAMEAAPKKKRKSKWNSAGVQRSAGGNRRDSARDGAHVTADCVWPHILTQTRGGRTTGDGADVRLLST